MQTIVYGAGAQAVSVYATDALGRFVKPTSATAKIVDLEFSESDPDADRIILDTSAATVDAFSTTSTAAAGPSTANPRLVPITAGVPVVGRHYAITSAGLTESFEVARVDGLNVYARDELRGTFATSATVTGLLVTAEFPADRADDADELDRRTIYGVDWVFAGTTGPAYRRTLARIERRLRAPRASVDDLTRLDPLLATAARDSTKLESHLLQADIEVTAKQEWRGCELANVDEGRTGMLAVAYAALELAYRTLGDEYLERADWAMRRAEKWLGMLTSGHKADDQIETVRHADRVPRKRRAVLPGVLITGSSS